MRKLCIPLTLIATLAFAVGCEDGPNQTFSPAPGGAASNWNTGSTDAAVTPGSQDFDAGYPTSNKTALCSSDFKRDRWSWMLTQPIIPPRFYAGLDMAKNDLWEGLTIEDAERPPADPGSPTGGLCQSTPLGFQGTCPSGYGGCNGSQWGNNGEVFFSWNTATHYVDQMVLTLGYTGQLVTQKYPDHLGDLHAYSLQVGDVIRRDGQAFQIPWQSTAAARIVITDIFNAVMASFAKKAGVPFDTSSCMQDSDCAAPGQKTVCECAHSTVAGMTTTCKAAGQCGVKNCGTDGNCLVYHDGSVTIFGIRPMVVYVQGSDGVPQPALSTPTLFYNFFSKWEPFVHLPSTLKIDADGPFATGAPIGIPKGATTVCTQRVGQTFGDFRDNCVQVHGDKSDPNGVDVVNLNKVTHSLAHDQEHWTANVLGINQNFTSLSVLNSPDKVVLDTDQPQPGDIAQDFFFDIRARGTTSNDYAPSATGVPAGGGPDLRGSALLMIEWARLMLNQVAQITGKPVRRLGDPACVGFDAQGQPNYKSTTGCTGIEGMIIPTAPAWFGGGTDYDFTKDPGAPCPGPSCLDPGNNRDNPNFGYVAPMVRPGDVHGGLCIDPGPMTDCTMDQGKSPWYNILAHVTRVMGNGDINALPAPMRDRRFYYRAFGEAMVKYYKAYGNYMKAHPTTVDLLPTGVVGGGLGPSDVKNTIIDRESLFYDYLTQPGAGSAQTFDKFEYVDREFIGTGAGGTYNWIPWDFDYGCDLFGGNQRSSNWFRRMDREEIGLYSAMLEDKTHTPGQENNVNITNLFGSIMLGGDPVAHVAGLWPSYACAIGQAGDPAVKCLSPVGAPLNAPLDPVANSKNLCNAACTGAKDCAVGNSYETGAIQACGPVCDFVAHPLSGCASKTQVCVANANAGACLEAKMDLNAGQPNAVPILAHYPGAWSRTPFSRGHSPITLKESDKHANIGVAHVSIPNFKDGPYTFSPAVPTSGDAGTDCQMGWTKNALGLCDAPLNAGMPGTTLAPVFNPLTPWLEVQSDIGFGIPVDAQHAQWVASGQFDYTGILESYIVDYVPYVDPSKHSCVSDGTCHPGFACNAANHSCEATDNTLQILAIEGADFLGETFVCVDPLTSDILHIRMYDSAQAILDWLAAHPGGSIGQGVVPSAQAACGIIVKRTPYDNYLDSITSKTYGVQLNVGGGQGLGRVTDIVVFDPALIQAL